MPSYWGCQLTWFWVNPQRSRHCRLFNPEFSFQKSVELPLHTSPLGTSRSFRSCQFGPSEAAAGAEAATTGALTWGVLQMSGSLTF